MVIVTDEYYSFCNSVGIYRWNYRRNIQKLKKKRFIDVEIFTSDFTDWITERFKPGSPYNDVTNSLLEFPMASLRNSKRNLHTVTCHFTNRGADEITDRMSPWVSPSVKVNISPLCRLSHTLFLLLLPHPNSLLTSCKQPPLFLKTSHISLSFVATTSVFWFTVDFIIFYK